MSNQKLKPFHRFFARYVIDYFLIALLMMIATGITFGIISTIIDIDLNTMLSVNLWGIDIIGFLVIIISYFFWIFIEAYLLSTWGTTPGKFLYNIQVRTLNGDKLSYKQALSRSIRVWVFGIGMGLPIIYLFTMCYSYYQLLKNHVTRWDKDEFSVTHTDIHWVKWLFIGIICTLYIAFVIWGPTSSKTTTTRDTAIQDGIHALQEKYHDMPIKLSDEVEMTRIHYKNNEFIIDIRLVNTEDGDPMLNLIDIYKINKKALIAEFCHPWIFPPLLYNTKIIANVYDKNNILLVNPDITKEDCENGT